MPHAGAALQLSTSETALYDSAVDGPPRGCTFCVRNLDDEAVVLVNIEQLHGDDWFAIEPGEMVPFRLGDDDIKLVKAKAASGTPSVNYGFVARISP